MEKEERKVRAVVCPDKIRLVIPVELLSCEHEYQLIDHCWRVWDGVCEPKTPLENLIRFARERGVVLWYFTCSEEDLPWREVDLEELRRLILTLTLFREGEV